MQQELLAEGFAAHEVDTIIKNVVDLHGDLGQSVRGMERAVGITRQGIFLAPAIIQAMNGDSRGLEAMLAMMGADMAIDHVGVALVGDAKFLTRFPKISRFFSKSAGLVASPVGKILLLSSFVELTKQMQESEPGTPQHELAQSLLLDNTIMFAGMLAEVLGFSLGPMGIIVDLGITIHQLLATAQYYQESLPIKVSLWKSVELVLGFKKVWLDEQLSESVFLDEKLRWVNKLSKIVDFSSVFLRVPEFVEKGRKELDCDAIRMTGQQLLAPIDTPQFVYTPVKWEVFGDLALKRTLEKCEEKIYSLANHDTVTASLHPPSGSPSEQEAVVFKREEKKCGYVRDFELKRKKRALIVQWPGSGRKVYECTTRAVVREDHWKIGVSSRKASGERYSENPIEINGGLAGLMINNKPYLKGKNFLAIFDPCLGDVDIVGGDFLKDQSMTVFIATGLQKENLVTECQAIRQTKLTVRETGKFVDKITYFVGDNYHHSTIKDDDNLNIKIVLLPIAWGSDISNQRTNRSKAAFSYDNEGMFFYLGRTGPSFTGLDKKNKVSIEFRDYPLTGSVSLNTTSLQLLGVKGDPNDPPDFFLKHKQTCLVSLAADAGKTAYWLEGTKALEVTSNGDTGPSIKKVANEAKFTVFMDHSLNDLSPVNNSSDINLSITNVLNIKKFNTNATLSIFGAYSFTNNQTVQAVLSIDREKTDLVLLNVTEPDVLLRDKAFFDTLTKQKIESAVFSNSNTQKSLSVSLDSNKQQFIYQDIRYRFDTEHGLVAIQGRAQDNGAEDFSNSLTNVIDTQSNTLLPVRLNTTTVKFAERQFVNLKPNSYLLTAQGKLPLGLLPLQLTTPQQGDSIHLDEIADLLHPSIEIDRVSLKPGGLGDDLIVHYRSSSRLKRAISTFTTEKNSIKICFKKSDDTIPKTVVIGGKTFAIDFSELPLLNPLEPTAISHHLFKQLSNHASLATEEINGEVLVEMRLERDKPSEQTIYRMPVNVQAKPTTFRFVDTETKQEKQLSATSVPANHNWSYATAAGATLIGAAALLNRYFKPRNNNPLPVPLLPAALPLLSMLPSATATVVNTMTETAANIASSFWQTSKQAPAEPRLESFAKPKQQRFFDSNSFFSSTPSSNWSGLGEQLCNKADKSGLLQLMHFYALSRASSKQTKANKLQTFLPAKNREHATITANKIVGLILAETEKQAKQLDICDWDLAVKINFSKLQKSLIDAIEVGNIETIASALHHSIKGLKSSNAIPIKNMQELETYIEYLVDQVFFQNGPFAIKQYRA